MKIVQFLQGSFGLLKLGFKVLVNRKVDPKKKK